MGQSSSTEQGVPPELREVQSLAASTGALPSLQKAFSLLSNPLTKSIPLASLQKCFDLTSVNIGYNEDKMFEELPLLLSHLDYAIANRFVADKNGVNEVEFLRGYTNCCGRADASTLLMNLLAVFAAASSKAGFQVDLQFEMPRTILGSFTPRHIRMLLWICWIFSWDSRMLRLNAGKRKGKIIIPDISHLVFSAIEACGEGGPESESGVSEELDVQLSAEKFHTWALKNVPNLADCFQQFVSARLCYLTNPEDKSDPSCSQAQESSSSAQLLTPGRAWAISLSLRGSLYEEMSKACFPSDDYEMNENLLYRSSGDGKGLNRFWSKVEGYKGPLLILISASEEKSSTTSSWIIGALTSQGFENKDSFYGNSGSLYALNPVFHAYSASGREKNFVYSHLRGRQYEATPKPVGIAFGGYLGNERILLDEDFTKVTLRHHAVDKTYQHGSLFPKQGFLPTEASVFQVEVWGLGGTSARKVQASYKKREEIFTDQRRKVDLKNFSWEDSPEKMMMDMMSNPNAPSREER